MIQLLVALLLVALAVPASAGELTVGEYVENRLYYRDTVVMLLDSLYVGYSGIQSGKPVYLREACIPADFRTTKSITSFMDEFIALTPHLEDLTLGEVLFMALKEKYPCP